MPGEQIPFAALAQEFGTPLFVYDGQVLRDQFAGLRDRLHPAMEIFYSLKSNPNLSVCALLGSLGARAEVSSLVELLTARRAGLRGEDIIFLGPGKSAAELSAGLDEGLAAIVCESFGELALIEELAAARGQVAPVALRVNPDFAVKGAGLTMGGKPRQFGIDAELLFAAEGLARGFPHVRLMGVHVYLGTRILSEDVVVDNVVRIFDLAERLATALGFPLEFVDVGGGLGVAYFDNERDLDVERLTDRLNPVIDAFARAHPATRLVLELGRYLTALAGTYMVAVRYVKTSMGESFAVTDGGTNHHMAAVGVGSPIKRNFPMRLLNRADPGPVQPWQVCGPLCTPNDTIGKGVALPPLVSGDLLGVLRSGAYGPSASPGLFLSHGFPAEVLVDGGRAHLIRARDTPEDLLRPQRLAPNLIPVATTDERR
jgi:diaminopimelate decarboxylase